MNVIQQKAIEETKRYYNIARKLYPQFNLGNPEINFRLRGASAGRAYMTLNKIQYQPKLLEQNSEDFIARTVPHEVAHVVAYHVYEDAGHGEGWKHVMKQFKVQDVSRYHTYDVSNIRKTFPHSCSCKVHQLTAHRHNKIMKGAASYVCRLCRTRIE